MQLAYFDVEPFVLNDMHYYPNTHEEIDFYNISIEDLETLIDEFTTSVIRIDSRIARYAEVDDPEKLSLERKKRWHNNTKNKCVRVLHHLKKVKKIEKLEKLKLLKAQNIEIARLATEAKAQRVAEHQARLLANTATVQKKEKTPQQILEKKYAHEIHVRADLFRKAADLILDADDFQEVLEKYEQMLVDFDAGLGPYS